MQTHQNCTKSCCSCTMSRRGFLAAAGAMAAATQSGLFDFTSSLFAAEPKSTGKSRVRVVFIRPNIDKYWMGWPGAAYDIKARQKEYTKILTDAVTKLNVSLQITHEPLHTDELVGTFLKEVKENPPDGIIVISMCLHHSGFSSWAKTNNIAKNRGDIPTIVFSPMGTSFTGDLQATRNIPGVFLAATQDLNWLAFGLKMFNTIHEMKNTRLCIVAGNKTYDRKLDVIGTTLHYVPRNRFPEEFNKAETTDEMREIANHYAKGSEKIVEPNKQDILNSAKNYVVAKRIMAAENCQGISMDCLGLIGSRQIPCPPCMAWLQLNNEGSVGCCEADVDAAISLRLTSLLFDRPGFMQDPAPNTVNNTLMGAHCSCPTKLDGFDSSPEPLILRNHSESELGVSPQVLWRIGQKVTVMEFAGPGQIILGTGSVLRNIDTPPAGGCRTSVELEMDDMADTLDTKGFHQLFIYGNLELPFKAYCQLAGIKVVHI
ncbi:MAG: hypothetical protein OEW48_13145 [Phycisphaerae bacterium]|nr:hypothetical protein [Phycisphaerae bacterium]